MESRFKGEANMNPNLMLSTAIELATRAHAEQVDKSGVPYIFHPLRVMEAVRKAGYDERYQIVAVLHDVIEDTRCRVKDGIYLFWCSDVYKFPKEVMDSIGFLTHQKGDSNEEYIQTLRKDPIAKVVKYYDIMDNLSPERLANLNEEDRHRVTVKYYKNLIRLTGEDVR